MSVIENAIVMMTARPTWQSGKVGLTGHRTRGPLRQAVHRAHGSDPDLVKTNKCTVTQLSETNRYKINYSKARLTFVSLAMNN